MRIRLGGLGVRLIALLALISGLGACGASSTPLGAELSGVWSGPVDVAAIGLDSPPTDRLTIEFDDDHRLRSYEFDEFELGGAPGEFGEGEGDLSLEDATTFETLGSVQMVSPLDEPIWESTRFRFTYRWEDLEDPDALDLTTELTGQIIGGDLVVSYTARGIYRGSEVADAEASGVLVRD